MKLSDKSFDETSIINRQKKQNYKKRKITKNSNLNFCYLIIICILLLILFVISLFLVIKINKPNKILNNFSHAQKSLNNSNLNFL